MKIPVTYQITDYNAEEIQGSFCEEELQKTKQDISRIEKIIRQQEDKSLFKWFSYLDSCNSWVDYKDINKLQSESPMFATVWPGFQKFSQVTTLYEYSFS